MVTVDILKNQGWYLSPDGLGVVSKNGTIQDLKAMTRNALDIDLKDIGAPILASQLGNNKIDKVVLQIQKLRNISAPKSNEDSQAAPRMLKFILTDGHSHCQGIEFEQISSLHHSRTVPGTKILLNGAKISNGYILIDPKCCTVLGGKVPALYERWEVAKSVSNTHQRLMMNSGSDGPPAWVNFGQKILTSMEAQAFKSLENKQKEDAKQNTEFESQRKDAIAEAASGVRKVFGGGTKQALNHNQENNARKPMNFNKDRDSTQRYDRNNRKSRREPKEREDKPQRPSENLSLFDFLANKIPVAETVPPSQVVEMPRNFDNRNRNLKNSSSPRYENKFGSKPQPYSGNKGPRFSQRPEQYPPITTANPTRATVDTLTEQTAKMSLNSEFASRSFRQHLGLPSTRSTPSTQQQKSGEAVENRWVWKSGDQCMAKYWEDGKYYRATIAETTDKTCVVQFNDYGNYEEVLRCDCIPLTTEEQEAAFGGLSAQKSTSNEKSYSGGSMEFRRGGNKPYNPNNRNNYRNKYN